MSSATTRVGETEATYTYLPHGLRSTKSTGDVTTSYVWDGSNTVLERVGSAVTAKYFRGINLISSQIGDTANYYLYNAHGDVTGLANASGALTKSYEYDAFGNEKAIDETDVNPYRYCGEYYDCETGRIYLRARYYDPCLLYTSRCV